MTAASLASSGSMQAQRSCPECTMEAPAHCHHVMSVRESPFHFAVWGGEGRRRLYIGKRQCPACKHVAQMLMR